ncbi:adenine-specific DNA-methyltransferase [soil metagenome]
MTDEELQRGIASSTPPQKLRAGRNRTLEVLLDERERLAVSIGSIAPDGSRLICGDAFAELPHLDAGTIDLLFADPPYNLSKKFGVSSFKAATNDEYAHWLDSWITLCMPLLRKNASVYICGDWRSTAAIQRVGSRYFRLRNRITWEREKGRGAKANWKNTAEDIWYFTVSDEYTFNLEAVKQRRRVIAPYRENGKPKDWTETESGNFRDSHPSNIWTDITVPFWSMPENTDHPTQKPEKLLAKIVLASTNPVDMILDPFAGSGTTAVVAKKLSRRFIAIESDEDHCLLAAKRLELADSDKTIQGFTDGVFWERNSSAGRSDR